MSEPKFRPGDVVTFARPTLVTPDGRYEVVRIFPEEGLDRRCAIRRADEPYDRVVSEHELRSIDRIRENAEFEPAAF